MSKKKPPAKKPAPKPRSLHGWSCVVGKDGTRCVHFNRPPICGDSATWYSDNELHLLWLADWTKQAAAWMEDVHGT